MTDLPAISAFNASTVTEGQWKAAFADLHGYLAATLGTLGDPAAAQVALGVPGAAHRTRNTAWTMPVSVRGEVITLSGSWTLTLPQAASAGQGWMAVLRNSGSGTVTLQCAGSDQIDGATSAPLGPGAGALVMSDGAGWISSMLGPAAAAAGGGALLARGQFGLGLTGNAATLDEIDDTALPSGQYRLTAAYAGSGALPGPLQGQQCILEVRRYSATVLEQTVRRMSPAGVGGVWRRVFNAGAWGPWLQTGGAGILGTVAMAAGIPTGAILEAGANANGSYFRLASGRQLCFNPAVGTAATDEAASSAGIVHRGAVGWTYPAAFAAAPLVSGIAVSAARWGGAATGVSATAATLWHYSDINSATATAIGGLAVGNWT